MTRGAGLQGGFDSREDTTLRVLASALKTKAVSAVLGFVLAVTILLAMASGAQAAPVQFFYVPLPEDQILTFLTAVENGGPSNAPEDPITSYITITAVADGTIIYYDQWENGFDTDIASTLDIYSATNLDGTQIWGDGDPSNGAPPGIPTDLIDSGTLINLSNDVVSTTRQSVIDFDGGDKIAATKTIALTRTSWAAVTTTLFAGCVEVFDTNNWGTEYRAPVGENLADTVDYQMFEYTALAVMASKNGTSVQIDKDNNGVYETTLTMDEGQSTLIEHTDVGAHILADKPIQVDILSGDVASNYESRDSALLPVNMWASRYYTPVSTADVPTHAGDERTTVWLYNPGTSAITVTYERRNTSGVRVTSTLTVNAGTVNKQILENATDGTGAAFYTSGAPFYAYSTTDSASSTYSNNQAWDWSYTMIPSSMLTTQGLIGLGLGRDPTSPTNPTENGNPIWVTPVGNGDTLTRVYVDYDVDPSTGSLTDPTGAKYDAHYDLRELEQARVYVRGLAEDATSSGTTGDGTSSATLDITHVTGTLANRLMLVGVAIGNDENTQRNVQSITYGGVPLTYVGSVISDPGGSGSPLTRVQTEIWALANPASGSATVQVTLTGARAFTAGVTTFSGADVSGGLSTALDVSAFASASGTSGTTQSVDVSTAAGQMVYDAVAAGDFLRGNQTDPSYFTAGSGQTQLWTQFARSEDGNRDRHVRSAGSTETATGTTTTMDWTTWTSYPWAIAAVPINPITSKNDQTGMLVYTLSSSVKLAIAWGQDPWTATAGAPGLDVGTSIPPMPEFTAGEDSVLWDDPSTPGVIDGDRDGDGHISPGDEIVYVITAFNISRLPVPNLYIADLVPDDTTYVPQTTYLGTTHIPDDTSGTPCPLDGAGINVGTLAVGGEVTVTYRVVIDTYEELTPGTDAILNNGTATALGWVDPVDDTAFLRGRIGDLVWYDTNTDGIQDPGEPGLEGVHVRLLNCWGGQLYNWDGTPMELVTDSNGYYEFKGLPPAWYIVEFVAPDGSGFSPKDQGGSDAQDSDADPVTGRTGLILLMGGQRETRVDAGLYRTSPIVVVVNSFDAHTVKNGVVLTWETASEANTAGFYLERLDPNKETWHRVGHGLVPAMLESSTGGWYSLVDRGAKSGTPLTYRLVEMEMTGAQHIYGPYEVTAVQPMPGGEAATAIENGAETARVPKQARLVDAAPASPSGVVGEAATAGIGDRLRIEVSAPGLYRVEAADLVAGLGLSEQEARNLISSASVKLTEQARSVAYIPASDGSALYFYGQAVSSIYASRNVYWLTVGPGLTMTPAKRAVATTAVETVYVERVHAEQNVFPITEQFHRLDSDFWLWDYVAAGFAPLEAKTFAVDTPGCLNGARLAITLRGLTTSEVANEHHATIEVNGVSLGDTRWTGTASHTVSFRIPAGALRDGANEVVVRATLDTGVPFSLFAVDSIDVSYERNAAAVSDQLIFDAPSTTQFRLSGLSSATAWVLDLTKPVTPAMVQQITTGSDTSGTWVQFPAVKGRRYLVATAAGSLRPDAVAGAQAPGLKAAGRGADYVVITSPALGAAAGRLAAYRQSRGLTTAVVTTTQIYDEFNYGVPSPHAIEKFVSYAITKWAPVPRYVVLAGEGSYDYKDYLGNGDSLVPPLMVDTEHGLAPSDVKLADVKGGDGVPEVAIGRIPGLVPGDIDAALAKIQAYEAAGAAPAGSSALLAADNMDDGGDFASQSDTIAAAVPAAPLSLAKAYVGPKSVSQVRAEILGALGDGTLWLSYVGHGGEDLLAAEELLTSADVASLGSRARLPIVTAFTCKVGQYGLPGYDGLSETLVKRSGAGAIGVWSPSTMEESDDSARLGAIFSEIMFGGSRSVVLGDVIRAAGSQAAGDGLPAGLLLTYNLLGDPALRVDW